MNNILTIIADNPALFEALKEVIEKQFDVDTISLAEMEHTNEFLGAMVRAQIDGLHAVRLAFKEIEKYRTLPPTVDRPNPGS